MDSPGNTKPPKPGIVTQKLFFTAQILSRIMTVGLTVCAALVMVNDKEVAHIDVFDLKASYKYSPSFKFFVVANVIVSVFVALSVVFLMIICRTAWNPAKIFVLFLNDLIMMSLTVSACAAATAMGTLAKHGNGRIGWMAICDRFGSFCQKASISIVLSYLALVQLVLMVIISAFKSRQIIV